jgi:ABC-2 type transport system ATP-binding protein
MDEAEHLCDRVAVVDRGKVVAVDTPQGLIDGLGLPSVVQFSTCEPDLSWLEKLEVVESLTQRGNAVEMRGHGPLLALVASELVAHGIVPLDLRVERPTLEDAFLVLTGREVRA